MRLYEEDCGVSGLLREGRPWPMGASLTEAGVNFAVFSANAAMIETVPLFARRAARSGAAALSRASRRHLAYEVEGAREGSTACAPMALGAAGRASL